MVGLPCSGKTTAAKELEQIYNALRLTPDEWHIRLFGHDEDDHDKHDIRHTAVEQIMWDVAARALTLGDNVILDFGFWAKSEREDFRERAKALGVDFKIHYQEVSRNELLSRLEERNRIAPTGAFIIPQSYMERYMSVFQPPDLAELME
jgi:predicted kinase